MGYTRKVQNPESRVRQIIAQCVSPIVLAHNDSGGFTTVAGTSYAQYIGPRAMSVGSMVVEIYVAGTPAAGAGWAEIALATGTLVPYAATMDLTCVPGAFASMATEVFGVSTTGYIKTLTPTTPVPPGQGLWLLFSASFATTQPTVRYPAGGEISGLTLKRADAAGTTTRPSLNGGTARTFTSTAGTVNVVPWMRAFS